MEPDSKWTPKSERQLEFVESNALEIAWRAGRGAGKTAGLVAAALRDVEHARYRAVIIGGQPLDDEMHRQAPVLGGTFHAELRWWKFQSGATIVLAGYEDATECYDGLRFDFVGVDNPRSEARALIEVLKTGLLAQAAELPLRYREVGEP